MQFLRRAWVEVDLGALRRNGAALAAHAGRPLLAVVKADAYGLGALQVVRALEPLAPWGYGVATVAEGEILRANAIERPILLLTPLMTDEFVAARKARLTPSLGDAAEISRWAETGGGAWHLAIDTGMSRAGVRWDDMASVREPARRWPPQGAFTHYHSADIDDGTMRDQDARFTRAIAALDRRPAVLHAENSASIIRRRSSEFDVVRPGIFLYGGCAIDGAVLVPEPVVHLRSRIVAIRTVPDGETVSYGATYRARGDRRIATLAIGYAEGYPRALGNVGSVLVRGRLAPVAGTVTMDMTMIDVTGVHCEVGDTVTLMGRDGTAELRPDEVARLAGTVVYELFTGLTGHVEHVYSDNV